MTLKNHHNLFKFDKSYLKDGSFLIGTDEAGRGPGAGGVFAAAVYFKEQNSELIEKLSSLNDSKKLNHKKREELYEIILSETINSIVCIEVEEIEKINILNASLKAMKLACVNVINELSAEKSQILTLVDGNKSIKEFNYPQKFIIKGDAKSASIAAASILAKVSRDRYMQELDKKYPKYNWKKNAGYLTKEHLNAIDIYGTTPVHRISFLQKHFNKVNPKNTHQDKDVCLNFSPQPKEASCNSIQLNLYQK